MSNRNLILIICCVFAVFLFTSIILVVLSFSQRHVEADAELVEAEAIESVDSPITEIESLYDSSEDFITRLSAHSWKRVVSGDVYGQCLLEVVKFSTNGQVYVEEKYYVSGNRMKSSSFNMNYNFVGNSVYIDGNVEFYFDGTSLRDTFGNVYQSGSELLY